MSQTFTPTSDAYVRGGTSGSTNYGTARILEVKKGTDANYFRKSYVKFDLSASGLSSITSAKVRLYASVVSSFSVTAYQTTDIWTETSITWNNAPETGMAISALSINKSKQYYEWDVTEFVQSQLAGDKIISLVFDDASSKNLAIDFNSKEVSTNKPQLVIVASSKQNQTITFPAISSKVLGDADFNPGATASSGLPVSYSSSNTAVATIVSGNIHIVGAGTSTITASQAGNSTYNAAPDVTQTLTVTPLPKQNQIITFAALPVKVFGDADFSPGATASSGLSISYSSSNSAVATIVNGNIHILGAGTSTITASQTGDATYNAAPNVTQTLIVNKASQTITFNSLLLKVFGDADFSAGATANSGLIVTYSSSNASVATIVGGNIHIVGIGTTVITASQTGNTNYNGATDVTQSLTVNKANQTISFASIPVKVVGDADFNTGSSASSGLSVTLSSSNTAVATIVGTNIHIVGTGTSNITASQPGNTNYNAAVDVVQLLTVNSAPSGPAYYIDAVGGNDANNGTSISTPWKNISKLNSLTVSAGTQILLKAGSTWTGQQLKFNGSGTSASPIIVNRYGTGAKPVLAGNGLIGQGVLYLYNQSYIEVNNLEITNLPSGASFFNVNGGDRRGVMVVIDNYGTANHLYFKNLDIHHVKGQLGSGETSVNNAIPKRTGGMFFTILGNTETTNSKSRFNDVLVEGCNIFYCENIGIAIDNEWNVYYPGGQYSSVPTDVTEYNNWYARRNTNFLIRNNVIHHIGKNAMIIRMTDETCNIEHNVCYETAQGTTGNTMFTARAKGTIFQYNEGYYNRSTTQTVNPGSIDGSMYDPDYGSVGVIFQYSYSHDNSEGLYWGCNTRGSANNTSGIPDPGDEGCTLRYCVSQNDNGDLIFFNYPSAGNEIYNNVFFIKSGLSPNIIHESSKQHTYNFYNNIVYNLGTGDYALKTTGQTRTISNNRFYGFHKNIGDPTLDEPADPYKITSDPLFVNPGSATIGIGTLDGYKLQNNSPCINSGKSISNNGGFDYWGNNLYNGLPDIGANEYSSTMKSANEKSIADVENINIENKDFLIYPNPVNSGYLTIILKGYDNESELKVNIYSMKGNQVYSNQFYPADRIKINLQSDLTKGMYMISIRTGNKILTKKLIVK